MARCLVSVGVHLVLEPIHRVANLMPIATIPSAALFDCDRYTIDCRDAV